MSKSIKYIQLYRNGAVLATKELAVARLNQFASGTTFANMDGVAILARYYGTENDSTTVRTLFGIMFEDESGNKSITIVDADEAKKYVDEKVLELDFSDAEVANQYVSAVHESDGIISVKRKDLPVSSVDDNAVADKFVTSIKLDGNAVKAERTLIQSSQIHRTQTSSPSIKATTVEGALIELKNAITGSVVSGKVTVEERAGSGNVLKTYVVKQDGNEVGTIDIPKDLVVTSGSVVKGTWNESVFTEAQDGNGTALKLVIANQNTPVYINTLDLVKDHTSGNGISISDTNEISIKLAPVNSEEGPNPLTLTAEGLGFDLSGTVLDCGTYE